VWLASENNKGGDFEEKFMVLMVGTRSRVAGEVVTKSFKTEKKNEKKGDIELHGGDERGQPRTRTGTKKKKRDETC